MSQRTDYFRIILIIIVWIIFVGLAIEAGGFLTNMVITLFFNPEGSKKFWEELDLSKLYQYNQSRYVTLTSLMVIAAILKTLLFYVIVKITYDKRLSLARPFNEAARRFALITAYLSLGIGLFCAWGAKFTENMMKEGVTLPDIQKLKFGGSDVWLFMGITLLCVGFIFKKGIDLQTENDLTV